jgi:hypothetical protein
LPILTFPPNFPDINLESEQPHHHQVIEIIEDSKDERIYAAQHNASLDDPPYKTAGVSAVVDKVDTFKFLEVNTDHFMSYPPCPPSLSLRK